MACLFAAAAAELLGFGVVAPQPSPAPGDQSAAWKPAWLLTADAAAATAAAVAAAAAARLPERFQRQMACCLHERQSANCQ